MNTNKLIPLLPEMAVFVCVVESDSFSKAAERLGVAPSSVSRSIAKLEQALEEKLLERTTRQMRLTVTGQEVFSLCNDMLTSARLAVDAAHSDKAETSGALRVAAPKAYTRQVLTPHLLDFVQANPKVSLQFRIADHYIDPVGADIDIIIHITQSPVEGLIAKRLGECRLTLCASPQYIEQHGQVTHPSQLSAHNCICLGESPKDRTWDFNSGDEKVSVNVTGSLAINHSEIRRDAVVKGLGIALFPDFAIAKQIEDGSVISLLSDWHLGGNYQGEVVAQYTQSKFIPSQIKAFVEFLQHRLCP